MYETMKHCNEFHVQFQWTLHFVLYCTIKKYGKYKIVFVIFCFPAGKSFAEFRAYIIEDNSLKKKMDQLKDEVKNFAGEFPLPGFDKT